MLPETSLSGCRKNVFAFVALLVVILITYSNTFDASWHFDDENNILENNPLHLTELNMQDIKRTFFADWNGSGKLYRPVACLSFALNYYFGGTEVYGYHLINLIIHVLSSVFLFLFVYHTLNLPLLKKRYGSSSYFIALLSALLWAINPMQTQAVTYVVQRMTSMAGMFSIMAMYFYLKGKMSTQNPLKAIHYFICCVCGILALGSKENAVMLPMVILLYDLFLIQGVTKRNIKRYLFFFLIAVLICVTIALVIAGPSILDPKGIIAGYQNRGFSLSERLLTEPRVILFYISLLLYPMPDRLCLEHNITLSSSLITPISTIISIIVIVLIFCLACASARKRPLISFCVLFFLMNHLIEASVFPLELVFEHRNYLPSMFFFVPLSILLSSGLQLFSRKRSLQVILIIFAILVLIGWGHSTYARNMVWKNDGSLSFDCVEKYPDLARPHHNLGVYYGKKNMYQNAIDEYLISLTKENRNNLMAKNWTFYNLGSIYQKMRKDNKALFYYEQAQKYQPQFAPTHVGKGVLFMRNGLFAEAESEFKKAIDGDRAATSAYGNLGFLLLLTGETGKAINNLKIALEKSPQNAKIMRHLGLAYKLNGMSGKAYTMLNNSLELDPNNPYTLLDLADLYCHKGMEAKKDEIMVRFFAVFDGSASRIEKFINGMAPKPGTEDALIPYRKNLITLLSDACRNRSEMYMNLAGYCLQKKGELTMKSVHPSD